MMSEQREFETPQRRPAPIVAAGAAVLVILAAGALLFALGILGGQRGRDELAGAPHPAVGKQLEFLALAPLTGDPPPVSLADLDGKVTLINFWGPWCGPCATEFPRLMEIEQHYRGRDDFQLVSVAYPSGPHDAPSLAADTAEFLAQNRASIRTHVDPGSATALRLDELAELRGFVFPTTVVVGRDRTIRGLWAGYRRGDEIAVDRLIEQQLRQAPNLP
jgi:thiol-disulfide isomerase/thioredoxin